MNKIQERFWQWLSDNHLQESYVSALESGHVPVHFEDDSISPSHYLVLDKDTPDNSREFWSKYSARWHTIVTREYYNYKSQMYHELASAAWLPLLVIGGIVWASYANDSLNKFIPGWAVAFLLNSISITGTSIIKKFRGTYE